MPTTLTPITTAELHTMQMKGRIPDDAPVCGECGTAIVLTDRGWRHLLRVDAHPMLHADTHPAWPNTPEADAAAVVGEPTTVGGMTIIPVTRRSSVAVSGGGTGQALLTVRSESVGMMLALSLPEAAVDALVDALTAHRGQR